MSKPVRIRNDVIAQVEAAASIERRSLANMVEVLLLAALTERGGPNGAQGEPATSPVPPVDVKQRPSRSVSPADVAATIDGVKLGGVVPPVTLRDGKCRADVAFGTKCKLCGKVHT